MTIVTTEPPPAKPIPGLYDIQNTNRNEWHLNPHTFWWHIFQSIIKWGTEPLLLISLLHWTIIKVVTTVTRVHSHHMNLDALYAMSSRHLEMQPTVLVWNFQLWQIVIVLPLVTSAMRHIFFCLISSNVEITHLGWVDGLWHNSAILDMNGFWATLYYCLTPVSVHNLFG